MSLDAYSKILVSKVWEQFTSIWLYKSSKRRRSTKILVFWRQSDWVKRVTRSEKPLHDHHSRDCKYVQSTPGIAFKKRFCASRGKEIVKIFAQAQLTSHHHSLHPSKQAVWALYPWHHALALATRGNHLTHRSAHRTSQKPPLRQFYRNPSHFVHAIIPIKLGTRRQNF